MLQSADSSFASTDSTRRRSTFYVPLDAVAASASNATNLEELQKSLELIYNPDLSACSFDWSLDESLNASSVEAAKTTVTALATTIALNGAKAKRYGVVLNGIDLDDDHQEPHQQSQTSTPKKGLVKSESRCHIDRTFNGGSPALKEKSATLPQNMTPPTAHSTFPPKTSFLLKSSPKILFNYSSDAAIGTAAATASPSPKKSLSFIRRAHSTKLSRSNSLLKSLTSKCVDQGVDNLCRIVVDELQFERLERFFRAENCSDMIREWFFGEKSTGSSPPSSNCRLLSGGGGGEEGAAAADDEIHSGNFFNFT